MNDFLYILERQVGKQGKNRVNKAKKNRPPIRPPIWLMRQAGRSLSSYQALKEKYTFKELLKTPSLACQVTELPLKDIRVDVAILFSDILVVLEALGVGINYDGRLKNSQKKKPFIENALTVEKIKNLTPTKQQTKTKSNARSRTKKSLTDILFPEAQLSSLNHNYEAIKLYKEKNHQPLIGFCASPFTAFLYLFEKKASTDRANNEPFEEALTCFYEYPEVADELLHLLCDVSIIYAKEQIKSGVDAFKIFDTWANLIPLSDYKKRVEPIIEKMAMSLKEHKAGLPIIFFPRFFSHAYEYLSASILKNINALGVDYLADLPLLSERLNKNGFADLALQGNFPPFLLQRLSTNQLKKVLQGYLAQHKGLVKENKWIFNLGHGVLPNTPEKNLKALVEEIKNFDFFT